MRPIRKAILASVLVVTSLPFLLPGREARAAGDGPVRLEVLVEGVPLSECAARGTTYIEAVRGREYSLRITNLEPVRMAVAVSVDGRNSIVKSPRRSNNSTALVWENTTMRSRTISHRAENSAKRWTIRS